MDRVGFSYWPRCSAPAHRFRVVPGVLGGNMWQTIVAAWHDLSKTGRAVVVCVLGLAICGLLALAMWLGYDLSWLPGLLGAQS